MKNVRAGKLKTTGEMSKSEVLKQEYRWFHLLCYRQDSRGFDHPIDFPESARSDYTVCAVCRGSINLSQVSEDSVIPIRKTN